MKVSETLGAKRIKVYDTSKCQNGIETWRHHIATWIAPTILSREHKIPADDRKVKDVHIMLWKTSLTDECQKKFYSRCAEKFFCFLFQIIEYIRPIKLAGCKERWQESKMVKLELPVLPFVEFDFRWCSVCSKKSDRNLTVCASWWCVTCVNCNLVWNF